MTRTPRRHRTSGFTLVELMIVVAIIGILAAIAIPAFSRYVKKSRTAEASGHLNKIWSASVAYYEADHATAAGVLVAKQFPDDVATMEAACCGQAGDKCAGNATIYQTNATWVALNFNISDPHHYRPTYDSGGTGTAANFTAAAFGNLDCDTVLSTFQRGAAVNASSGDVEAHGAVFVDLEIE